MPGINESGERLLEMCAEHELVVGNCWFKKNDVYKYTWLRKKVKSSIARSLPVYNLLPQNAGSIINYLQ